jgi:hypothetical protein
MGLSFASERNSKGLERVESTFKNADFSFGSKSELLTNIEKVAISFWTNTNDEHKITLHDVKSTFNYRSYPLKLFEANSEFYDGTMHLRSWMNTAEFPMKIIAIADIKDADPTKLEELSVHFAKVHGLLSGQINFKNTPVYDLSGQFNFNQGTLTNYNFFQWMADTFALPSLLEIKFNQATTSVTANSKNSGLSNIYVDAPDVKIKGYFTIDNEDLVSSKLSLTFSRELLQQSPKFQSILKSIDDQYLSFNFQLSGNQHALNFKWLDSESKEKIRARIPDFIERIIERRVDTMMAPAPAAPANSR